MVKYELCWSMGNASTGRAPQQLTESPFKYLKVFSIPNSFVTLWIVCSANIAIPHRTIRQISIMFIKQKNRPPCVEQH